jgi:predicted amidohydrolase
VNTTNLIECCSQQRRAAVHLAALFARPWVMSKFLTLGYTLEQVVTMATINPARIINRAPKIGTLQIGAPGDVAIMKLVEGPVSFLDTRINKRRERQMSR